MAKREPVVIDAANLSIGDVIVSDRKNVTVRELEKSYPGHILCSQSGTHVNKDWCYGANEPVTILN